MNNKAISVDIKLVEKKINWFNERIQKEITHTVAGSASDTRSASAPTFWTTPYNKKAGQTSSVNILGGRGSNWANARDKKGKRLVGFTIRGGKTEKIATLSAYPMNLYENDVTIKRGQTSFVRKGTHIFRDRIPSVAEIQTQKNVLLAEQRINQIINQNIEN